MELFTYLDHYQHHILLLKDGWRLHDHKGALLHTLKTPSLCLGEVCLVGWRNRLCLHLELVCMYSFDAGRQNDGFRLTA